jgi:anti-sigma factor RsiW
MGHSDIAEWADYARNLIDDGRRRAMAAHLASGCHRCQRSLSALERVMKMAHNELQQPIPEHALRSVKALPAVHLPERAPRLLSLALQLAFDSFLEPAPAGIRNLDLASRHLVSDDRAQR